MKRATAQLADRIAGQVKAPLDREGIMDLCDASTNSDLSAGELDRLTSMVLRRASSRARPGCPA